MNQNSRVALPVAPARVRSCRRSPVIPPASLRGTVVIELTIVITPLTLIFLYLAGIGLLLRDRRAMLRAAHIGAQEAASFHPSPAALTSPEIQAAMSDIAIRAAQDSMRAAGRDASQYRIEVEPVVLFSDAGIRLKITRVTPLALGIILSLSGPASVGAVFRAESGILPEARIVSPAQSGSP